MVVVGVRVVVVIMVFESLMGVAGAMEEEEEKDGRECVRVSSP